MDSPKPETVETRLAVVEAKIRLISLVLKGAVAIVVTALVTYWFNS